MRPILVVKPYVGIYDMVEVRPTKAHKVAQAFPLDRSDPALNERIGVRGRDWRLDGFNPCGSEEAVEALCELRVAVV